MREEIEKILNDFWFKLARSGKEYDKDKAHKEATQQLEKLVLEAEEKTAEWFAEGIPLGFTKKTWLGAMRAAPELESTNNKEK